jgi:hypothetical protein
MIPCSESLAVALTVRSRKDTAPILALDHIIDAYRDY